MLFEKAIQLDTKYALAYAGLGLNYFTGWIHLLSADHNGLERAFQLEQQAIALDDSLPAPHSILATIYVHKAQYDQAVTEAERGIALNPNYAFGYSCLAEVMNNMAKPATQSCQAVSSLEPLTLFGAAQGFGCEPPFDV